MKRLRHMAIIVPACNEEERIAVCLDSIRASVGRIQREYPYVSCDVVVVLDRCADQTGPLVDSHGDRTITSSVGRVGGARHLGAIDAITRARHAGIPDHQVWLANTDADSTVPDTWLTTQFSLADAGFDAVIGTVTPAGLDSSIGANLAAEAPTGRGAQSCARSQPRHFGRAPTCRRAASRRSRCTKTSISSTASKRVTTQWITTHRTNVRTSARTQSRVEGGFASYLADLGSGDRS